MWNTLPFCNGNFGSSNLDTAIDLHRIAIDDLAIELESDLNPERALPGSSRTYYNDNWIPRLIGSHARENTMRKRITAQMRRSNSRPPMI
jgi:hypothetical protein